MLTGVAAAHARARAACQTHTRKDAKFSLKASYVEIYNENVYDLVHFQQKSLPVKWDAAYGFYVQVGGGGLPLWSGWQLPRARAGWPVARAASGLLLCAAPGAAPCPTLHCAMPAGGAHPPRACAARPPPLPRASRWCPAARRA